MNNNEKMTMRTATLLIIHCSATPQGVALGFEAAKEYVSVQSLHTHKGEAPFRSLPLKVFQKTRLVFLEFISIDSDGYQ